MMSKSTNGIVYLFTQYRLTPRLPLLGNQDLETEEYHDDQEIDYRMRT